MLSRIKLSVVYIVIPENVINLHINCENKIEDVRITEVTLLSSENNCILTTENTTVELRKSREMSNYIFYTKNISIPYASNNLDLLNDKLLPIQKQVNNEQLLNAGRTSNEIDNVLYKAINKRWTRTWTETITDTLTYLGYIALVLITLLSIYKCGICNLVRKCLPNLQVDICCTRNNVNNTATPTVVTYAPQAPPEHKVADKRHLGAPTVVKLRFLAAKRI